MHALPSIPPPPIGTELISLGMPVLLGLNLSKMICYVIMVGPITI